MVAGHCLVPSNLWSFGLGGLPATMLLGCWPLPCPFGTLQAQASHLVRGVFQLPCSLKLNFFVVLAAGCTLNPGCQDLGLFCRSFLCGTLSSSDQASVPSDALVEPRLDSLLMSRRRALGSGLFGCSSLRWAFFALGRHTSLHCTCFGDGVVVLRYSVTSGCLKNKEII